MRHVVPTTVRGWSTTKGRCRALSGTCLLMCMMDCTILVDSEVLKSLDTDLRLHPSLICQLLSANSHQNPQGFTLYALLLSVFFFFLYSFVCLASHLIFILPLWHIPLNVFNLAAFPNQSHTPLAESSAGFLLLIHPLSLPLYPTLDTSPCAVSVCRARRCEHTLLVSIGRNRLMHSKHQPCKPGMHNTKEWCLEFAFKTLVLSRTVQ